MINGVDVEVVDVVVVDVVVVVVDARNDSSVSELTILLFSNQTIHQIKFVPVDNGGSGGNNRAKSTLNLRFVFFLNKYHNKYSIRFYSNHVISTVRSSMSFDIYTQPKQ